MSDPINLLTTPEQRSSCGCGGDDDPPVLDVRAIPHRLRHATVHGALGTVRSGESIILVAPHDPKPLLAEIEQRYPGDFTVSYLTSGPEAWRLALSRV